MMVGNKAQAAMEYLMTYGWAILVVMVVGIAMWQLGIFNMGGASLTSTGFSKIKPQLAGSGIAHNGQIKAIFTNGIGTVITVKSGRVVDLNNPVKSCSLTSAMFIPNRPSGGDNMKVSSALTSCITNGKAGDVYQARISINYDVTIGGITTSHAESGTFRGPLE
jgi:hypothetical protein